jgi:hypothetical protein
MCLFCVEEEWGAAALLRRRINTMMDCRTMTPLINRLVAIRSCTPQFGPWWRDLSSAARFTESRADNFDIYLPNWLARHNKTVFGTLFVFNELIVLWFRMK